MNEDEAEALDALYDQIDSLKLKLEDAERRFQAARKVAIYMGHCCSFHNEENAGRYFDEEVEQRLAEQKGMKSTQGEEGK